MSKANDAEKIRTLSKIDLNLLTIFCLIYSVGSISRVADMLNISPSAVSQSLRKLREMMGDNLFVRSGNALLPTVYSDELYDNTIPIIDKLSTLMPLSTPAAKKRLTLYTESFISPIVIPDVTARIIETDADISLLHLTADLNEQSIIELLNMRQADVVFSTFSVESASLSCQKICDMRLVLAASQNNSLYVTPSVKRNSETLTWSVTILRMRKSFIIAVLWIKNSEPENAACLPHRLRRF